ncbi:MAG TPA: hypothetical protein VIS76_03730 [Pseudomonadales bacterium]
MAADSRRAATVGTPARALLTLVLCGAAACTGAAPEPGGNPAAETSPARTGEQLLAQPPAGWQQVGATNLAKLKRAEFVPEDETAETWTSRITFEALSEDPLPDPIEFVDLLATGREGDCGTFERLPTFSGEENGYPTSVDLLVCHRDRESDRSEVLLMKTIRGNEAFYVVTRGRRGPAIAKGGQSDIEAQEIAAWAVYLRSIKLCDDGRSEHPCPSEAAAAGGRSE